MKNKNNYNTDYDYLFKLMIVGDTAVGKTSFLKAIVGDLFNEEYIATKEYDFRIKKNIIIDDKIIKIQVWDTYIERFRDNRKPYRGAHGIFIVYDVTNRNSFQNVKNWYQEVERYAFSNVMMILVANKIDIPETTNYYYNQSVVSDEEGLEMSQKLNIPFISISSKHQINIDNCYLKLVEGIYDFRINEDAPPSNIKLNIIRNKKKNQDKCIIN